MTTEETNQLEPTAMAPTDETIAALKEEHGTIHKFTADGRAFIVREPDADEYDAFLDGNARARALHLSTHRAGLKLFESVCVWPDRKDVQAFCKQSRAEAIVVAGEVAGLLIPPRDVTVETVPL